MNNFIFKIRTLKDAVNTIRVALNIYDIDAAINTRPMFEHRASNISKTVGNIIKNGLSFPFNGLSSCETSSPIKLETNNFFF